MEKLEFDVGIVEYEVAGGGVLRFNPSDPNLFARFLEAEKKLQTLETELNQQAQAADSTDVPGAAVALSVQADKRIKELLGWVFGADNDFDKALSGVNLLALTGNGQRVVSNLFDALEKILADGAARFAAQKAEAIRARV